MPAIGILLQINCKIVRHKEHTFKDDDWILLFNSFLDADLYKAVYIIINTEMDR